MCVDDGHNKDNYDDKGDDEFWNTFYSMYNSRDSSLKLKKKNKT